jgi:hypothetical protein
LAWVLVFLPFVIIFLFMILLFEILLFGGVSMATGNGTWSYMESPTYPPNVF